MAAAIFVVAGSRSGQQGPEAAMVSTAGWAAAAERVLGQAWIVTPHGILDPVSARLRGSDPSATSSSRPPLRRRVPTLAKTAMKDVRSWRAARAFSVDPSGPWSPQDVTFVWQRHELFHDAGLRLARSLRRPCVLFVPATIVWEAQQWGTRRPGWGRWLEARGEGPALRGADVVACGSEAVAEQVRRLGVPDERVLCTPTGVDLDLFDGSGAHDVRARLGLEGRFVVGWVGSFRRFHAVEQAVDAVCAVEGASLLLVGDGPERPRIERLARDRGVPTVCTGTIAHDALPAHLAAMDAALLLAPEGAAFHYSPLKLAEYLAAGIPVVAPAVGQLVERLTDEHDALLVPAHDAAAVAAALRRLRDEPELGARLGAAGRATAEATWSWDHQVTRVLEALGR